MVQWFKTNRHHIKATFNTDSAAGLPLVKLFWFDEATNTIYSSSSKRRPAAANFDHRIDRHRAYLNEYLHCRVVL